MDLTKEQKLGLLLAILSFAVVLIYVIFRETLFFTPLFFIGMFLDINTVGFFIPTIVALFFVNFYLKRNAYNYRAAFLVWSFLILHATTSVILSIYLGPS